MKILCGHYHILQKFNMYMSCLPQYDVFSHFLAEDRAEFKVMKGVYYSKFCLILQIPYNIQ